MANKQRTYIALAFSVLGLTLSARVIANAPQTEPKLRLSSSMLLMPSDVDTFLEHLNIVPTSVPVVLSRKDAVAYEFATHARGMSQQQALYTASIISDEAERYGYDPVLFLSVITIESQYNHMAISPVGARGLMQIMPSTAMVLNPNLTNADPMFDPATNVKLGIKYLIQLHRQFHRMDYALTAYNRGPGNMDGILRNYGYLPENIHAFYAGKVLHQYSMLQNKYAHLLGRP